MSLTEESKIENKNTEYENLYGSHVGSHITILKFKVGDARVRISEYKRCFFDRSVLQIRLKKSSS